MGIVLNQSIKNTAITYFGFGIGAINALFLYTNLYFASKPGLAGVIGSKLTSKSLWIPFAVMQKFWVAVLLLLFGKGIDAVVGEKVKNVGFSTAGVTLKFPAWV